MPFLKIIDTFSKAIFSTSNTVVKTASKHKWSTPEWKYKILNDKDYPYLHSSDYLKELLSPAIKNKNVDALNEIQGHISRHGVSDIGQYKVIMKTIDKVLDNLDLLL